MSKNASKHDIESSWDAQSLTNLWSAEDMGAVELQCSLEYELARSAREVIAALSDPNSLFHGFACYLKKSAPEFPLSPWLKLPKQSQTNLMQPEHEWLEQKRLIPAEIFDSKQLEEHASENESESTLTFHEHFTSNASMDYRQRLFLYVDLNYDMKDIIDKIRGELQARQNGIEKQRIAHWGSPDKRKKRGLEDHQCALPTHNRKLAVGRVAPVSQLRQSLESLDNVRRKLCYYRSIKESDEFRKPGRYLLNVSKQYRQFGRCWAIFQSNLRYRQLFALDYNTIWTQSNNRKLIQLETPLAGLIKMKDKMGGEPKGGELTPKKIAKRLEHIIMPTLPR